MFRNLLFKSLGFSCKPGLICSRVISEYLCTGYLLSLFIYDLWKWDWTLLSVRDLWILFHLCPVYARWKSSIEELLNDFTFILWFYWFLQLYYLFMVHFTEYLDIWQPLNMSSVLMDLSISNFEAVLVSRDVSRDFSTARNFCLSGKKWLFIALEKILACEPEKPRTAFPCPFCLRYTDCTYF